MSSKVPAGLEPWAKQGVGQGILKGRMCLISLEIGAGGEAATGVLFRRFDLEE